MKNTVLRRSSAALAALALAFVAFATHAAYVPVEWIKASKTQWINTAYSPTATDKVEMKVKFSNVSDTQCLYCSRAGLNANTFTSFLIGGGVRFDRNTTTTGPTSGALSTTQDYEITADGDTLVCTVNTDPQFEAKMASGYYTPSGNPFTLFASYNVTTFDPAHPPVMGNFGSYTLYYFRVYDKDGNLVRNFIPARDDSVNSGTAQYGLYETQTMTFHPGLGSGSFSAGPDSSRWRMNPDTHKLECRISFASNYKARGSVAAEVGGSAASSPFWCVIGDSVQLTPTPASGYKFVRWMGDTDGVAVDAAGVATFPAAPRTLTAVFVPSSVDPVDRSWSGAGDGKDWFDANNWQPVGVPAEADFITIGTGKSIVLTNSTEELSSLTRMPLT